MGRRSRPRAIIAMLQLALDEMDQAQLEIEPARTKERMRLAQRMVVDAKIAVARWEPKA